jgi:hypothetical protein
MFGLMFVPPDIAMTPWGVRTQWSKQELTSLLMVMWPLQEVLQQLLHYANAFVCTHPVSNPLRGASIAGFTPEQMFSVPFMMAEPFLNGLAPSAVATATATPSSAAAAPSSAAATPIATAAASASTSTPGPSEQRAPMEQDEGNTSTSTVKAQSRRRSVNFRPPSLGLHRPKPWQVFPTGVLMPPGLMRFVEEPPPIFIFFFFPFLQTAVHSLISDVF